MANGVDPRVKRLQKEAKYYKDLYEKAHKDYQQLSQKHPLGNSLCIATPAIVHHIDDIETINYTDTYGVEKTIKKENEELFLVVYKKINPKKYQHD